MALFARASDQQTKNRRESKGKNCVYYNLDIPTNSICVVLKQAVMS